MYPSKWGERIGPLVWHLDPDLSVQEVVQEALATAGIQVRQFETAEALLAAIQDASQSRPDLLIIELATPGDEVDGWGILRYFGSNDELAEKVRLLIVSEIAAPEARERARLMAINTYLAKPVTRVDLWAFVRLLVSL